MNRVKISETQSFYIYIHELFSRHFVILSVYELCFYGVVLGLRTLKKIRSIASNYLLLLIYKKDAPHHTVMVVVLVTDGNKRRH